MKHLKYIIISLVIASCTSTEANLTVTGQIRGLKKGTLYLEQAQDSALIIIDSMLVIGDPEFILQTTLDEPEVLILRLDAVNMDPQRIRFFADAGITTIHSSLKRFIFDAKIDGSEQQKLLEEFNETIAKFNDQNLELIKKRLEVGNDSMQFASIRKEIDNLLKRKYLYSINFAMNNRSSEVAPYIALAEIFDANVKYLDTIYKALPDNIAKSKYGTELREFLKEINSSPNQ